MLISTCLRLIHLFLFSSLQNFLSYLNPSQIGINWEEHWWSSEDPQYVVFMSSPGPWLLQVHHQQYICNTVHVQLSWNNYQIITLLLWAYSFLQDSSVSLKYSICLRLEAAGLNVWRWNICSFNPHCFLLTTVSWIIFTIKSKLCKINKTINLGENINILNSNIATLQPCFCLSTVVSVVLIFKL